MVDPTAFLRVPSPGVRAGAQQGIAAIAQGRADVLAQKKEERAQGLHDVMVKQYQNIIDQQRAELDEDAALKELGNEGLEAWKAGDTQTFDTVTARIAAINPEAADAFNKSYGTIGRQNFVESAQNILAAAVVSNPEAQTKQLQAASDKLNVGPEHPFAIELDRISQMPPGNERDREIFLAVEYAKALGAYPVLSEQQKAGAKAAAATAGDVQKQVNVLRESLKMPRKIFSQVNAAKNRIDKIWEDASGASDLALIFNFMKMHDPESVVREAEFKTAETARGWWSNLDPEKQSIFTRALQSVGIEGMPAFIDILSQKLETGGRLTQDQRADMKNVSDKMGIAATETYDTEVERMLNRAQADQITGARVMGETPYTEFLERQNTRLRAQQTPPPGGQTPPPAPGTPEVPAGTPVMQPAAEPITVGPGEQTATNPQTGQTIVFRDGVWYDVATGQPVQ